MREAPTSELVVQPRLRQRQWPDNGLIEDIERRGVLSPLIAIEGDGVIEVIDGARRLDAAHKLGIETLRIVTPQDGLQANLELVTRIEDTSMFRIPYTVRLREFWNLFQYMRLVGKAHQAQVRQKKDRVPGDGANMSLFYERLGMPRYASQRYASILKAYVSTPSQEVRDEIDAVIDLADQGLIGIDGAHYRLHQTMDGRWKHPIDPAQQRHTIRGILALIETLRSSVDSLGALDSSITVKEREELRRSLGATRKAVYRLNRHLSNTATPSTSIGKIKKTRRDKDS